MAKYMRNFFCGVLLIVFFIAGLGNSAWAGRYSYDLRMISKQSLPSGNFICQLEKSDDNARLVDFLSDLDRVFARVLELGRKNRNGVCAFVIVPDTVDDEVNIRWRGGFLAIEIPADFDRISNSSDDLRKIVGALFAGGYMRDWRSDSSYAPDFPLAVVLGALELQHGRKNLLRINYYDRLRGMLQLDDQADYLALLRNYRVNGRIDVVDRLYFELAYAANELFRSAERREGRLGNVSYLTHIMAEAFLRGRQGGEEEFELSVADFYGKTPAETTVTPEGKKNGITEKIASSNLVATEKDKRKKRRVIARRRSSERFNYDLFLKVFNVRHPGNAAYMRRRLAQIRQIELKNNDGSVVTVDILDYPVVLEERQAPDEEIQRRLSENFTKFFAAAPQRAKRTAGDIQFAVQNISAPQMDAAAKKVQLEQLFEELENDLAHQEKIDGFLYDEEKKWLPIYEFYRHQFDVAGDEDGLISARMKRYFDQVESSYMQ